MNYRKNLWSSEKAGVVMGELMRYVDLCIANEEDADKVFGIRPADNNVDAGRINREGYMDVARELCRRFNCRQVAVTLRESISANDNRWSAMLYEKERACFSRSYLMHIVDRVGRRGFFWRCADLRATRRIHPAGGHRICRRRLLLKALHRI